MTRRPARSDTSTWRSRRNRRGHGALYGGLNQGRIDVARLRRALASMSLPRAADGWIVLAADGQGGAYEPGNLATIAA